MADAASTIAENLAEVRGRMAEAAQRSGRDPETVSLVAVTKYVSSDVAGRLPELGCRLLGESRPQQLWEKAADLQHLDIEWHMIGHLQRNKLRRTLPLVALLESIDSVRLLDAVQQEAARTDARVRALLEVNISGDPEKTGLREDAALQLCERPEAWPRLEICGLMAMSGRLSDAAAARDDYSRLRQLRDTMQQRCGDRWALGHLSMGMSRDYEMAIEQGATLVRVGSALFRGLDL